MKKPQSKRELSHRNEATNLFVLTGGAAVGLIGGLVVGLLKHHTLLFMQLGGVVGISAGALVEAVRFFWRKRADQGPSTEAGRHNPR